MEKLKKIGPIVVLVICLCFLSFMAIVKYKEYKNQEQLKNLQETARTTTTETESESEEVEKVDIPIDFNEVKKTNGDIVAWIEVPGTVIDYPILQSGEDKEEDFYLNHNLDTSAGYPGCIYMQKIGHLSLKDPVTVIYGHNMRNGTMFGQLHDFSNREFFDTNKEVYIYTPTNFAKYRIVAAVDFDNRFIPASYNYFSQSSDLATFLEDVVACGENDRNHLDEDLGDPSKNQYIVLSTCTGSDSNRWIVVARLEEMKEGK